MFRRLLLTLFFIGMVGTAHATNIHVRYFEAADAVLTENRFQLFSLAALEGEEITVVVYGLSEGIVPAITLFDPLGNPLVEELNPDNEPVVVIETTIPENGMYTFLVSRQTDVGGLIRVMAFEGDPFAGDVTIRDTIDPFLPARAFFAEGDPGNPILMGIELIENEAASDDIAVTEIFASRGTSEEVPPVEERQNPVQAANWTNSRGDVFYTLTVRTSPELFPSSNRLSRFASTLTQSLNPGEYLLSLGQGSEDIIDFLRPVCSAFTTSATETVGGPSDDYPATGELDALTPVELVGENGDYFLIVDPNSETGASWVEKSSIDVQFDLNSDSCGRVQDVEAPPLENPVEQDGTTQEGGSSNGGGSASSPVFGLPPADDPPPAEPLPEEVEEGQDGGGTISRPEPVPPTTSGGGFSASLANCAGGDFWTVTVLIANAPAGTSSITVTTSNATTSGGPGGFAHITDFGGGDPASIVASIVAKDGGGNVLASTSASIDCP